MAGLRLAALSLRDHPDSSAFIQGFAGDDRAVSDYLMTEVVERQPPDVLDFLLRTAIVDDVNGSLADALTGRKAGRAGSRSLCGEAPLSRRSTTTAIRSRTTRSSVSFCASI